MTVKNTGVVANWLNFKGIGFITPDGAKEGDKDILVHYSSIKQESTDGFKSLKIGSKVEYKVDSDPRDAEKQVATDVTGEDGADCEPREKGKGKGKGKGRKGKGRKGKGKGAKKEEAEDEEEE